MTLYEGVKLSKSALFTAAAFVLAGCASTTTRSDPVGWRAAIAQAAAAEIAAGGPPSIQIAVGQDGKIVFEGAWGLADVENNVPATTETMYRTASISKWMTAAAAMALVEKGKLDLDQPIQTYCPALPEKRWPITTRHLLTHTSGIRHYTDYSDELAAAKTDAERMAVELKHLRDQLSRYQRYTEIAPTLETFRDDALRFEPGTDYLYTSYGYRALACVLEGADGGRDFRGLLREEVFTPAGTPEIIDDDAWAFVPHRAGLYSLASGHGLRRADLRDVSENLPAGGHLATATELVRFGLRFYEGDIVSAESIRLMESPLKGPDDKPVEDLHGHGLMIMPLPVSGTLIGHTGGQAGTASVLFRHPERDYVVAVMSNADNWAGLRAFAETVFPMINKGLGDAG